MPEPRQLTAFRGDGRQVFRLVRGTDSDYLSDYEAQQRPRPPQRANTLIHMGLAMWSTMEGVIRANERCRPPFPKVAVVELRGEEGVWFARTFKGGHHTVWGRPDALERCVVDVIPLA